MHAHPRVLLHLTAHEVSLVSQRRRERPRYLSYHALLGLNDLDFFGINTFLLLLIVLARTFCSRDLQLDLIRRQSTVGSRESPDLRPLPPNLASQVHRGPHWILLLLRISGGCFVLLSLCYTFCHVDCCLLRQVLVVVGTQCLRVILEHVIVGGGVVVSSILRQTLHIAFFLFVDIVATSFVGVPSLGAYIVILTER